MVVAGLDIAFHPGRSRHRPRHTPRPAGWGLPFLLPRSRRARRTIRRLRGLPLPALPQPACAAPAPAIPSRSPVHPAGPPAPRDL